jgi:hypothetical protein
MQPIVSAGESSAVTITGKVRRRTLWRFVDSYGAADGIGPYSRVCSLFCSSFFWYSALFELFCAALPPIRAHSNTVTVPVGAGVCESHGSVCLPFAVLPLRQHLPRLRQRKGCELDLPGFVRKRA